MYTASFIRKITVYILLYAITGFLIFSIYYWSPSEGAGLPYLRLFIVTFATILLAKYALYMIVSPWYHVVMKYKERQLRAKRKKAYKPLVSVIVPAWNEEVGLVKTVETILESTYKNIEIVVVNDGSTDTSDERMKAFLASYEEKERDNLEKIPIIYLYKENGGKGRALNTGIGLSSGDIIISIDADCALTPKTIKNFAKYFEDPEVMAAVGNVKIGNHSALLGTLQYLEFLFSFYFKKADSILNTIYIIGGAAGAFRREIFSAIGMYNPENITEDIDLSVRIQKAGMKIVYAEDAIVYTEAATTIKGLAAQRLRWKRGRFQTFMQHRAMFFSDRTEHNKLLTWLILPLAAFGDIQLFFEIFFIGFLYIYSLLSHDFSSFISGIIVVSAMFFVQLFDDSAERKGSSWSLYLLAPIGWLLFYVTTAVEYRALVKAVWGMATNQSLAWQKWNRVGVIEPKV
jgi:poly-beta-1,6-N-acetyl-D-glucosamine synthase